MNMASTGSTAPFMVMLTLICCRGMPSNSIRMSSTESTATPAMPTSPARALVGARGVSVQGGGAMQAQQEQQQQQQRRCR
jgi:hypothetical protein